MTTTHAKAVQEAMECILLAVSVSNPTVAGQYMADARMNVRVAIREAHTEAEWSLSDGVSRIYDDVAASLRRSLGLDCPLKAQA